MNFGMKKFLPELLHFLYIVLQGFIGVRKNGGYFCGIGWKKATPCHITKFWFSKNQKK